MQEFTGIRDWKLRDVLEGDIVVTQQGTKFVVSFEEDFGFILVQSNDGKLPELKGCWFALKKYMQPNLEVIGSIYENTQIME
jgi:YopX protein